MILSNYISSNKISAFLLLLLLFALFALHNYAKFMIILDYFRTLSYNFCAILGHFTQFRDEDYH